MNVTLRQIRAFLAVAELGRFNLAASSLGLTQAAVSLLVKDLEAVLGVRLFDRHTRKVNLTAVGEEFLPEARKVIEDLDIATRNVQERAQLKVGQVTIASSIIFSATMVPEIVADFMKQHPGISVKILDLPEEEIRPTLVRNEADIALGTMPESNIDIQSTPIGRDRLTLTCHPSHPLVRKGQVRWKDLLHENVIALAEKNPLRLLVEQTMSRVARDFRPAFDVRFSTTAIGLVAAGIGVTVLPENSGELASSARIRTLDLVDPVVTRDICVMQHSWRSLSAPAERLKQMVLAHFADSSLTSSD